MRILFLCGCMEPGKDGVGDYTRRLSSGLIRSGRNVFIVALRDGFVKEVTFEIQESDKTEVSVLRIPYNLPMHKGLDESRKHLVGFEPDLISLQFVPYAFNPRGIPLRMPGTLARFYPDTPWHLMFHETYAGDPKGFKNDVVRLLQIRVLQQLVAKLNPRMSHTTIPVYQDILVKIGIKTRLLGLFGNIEITGDRSKIVEDNGIIQGVFFGASPKQSHFKQIALSCFRFIRDTGKRIHLTFCGKANDDRKEFIQELRAVCSSSHLSITDLGEMQSHDLSQLFLKVDFGMARVVPALIGKSGAALAILEHGLPLFVPLAESKESIIELVDFRPAQCFHDLADLEGLRSKAITGSRLPEIVEKLLYDLQAAQLNNQL